MSISDIIRYYWAVKSVFRKTLLMIMKKNHDFWFLTLFEKQFTLMYNLQIVRQLDSWMLWKRNVWLKDMIMSNASRMICKDLNNVWFKWIDNIFLRILVKLKRKIFTVEKSSILTFFHYSHSYFCLLVSIKMFLNAKQCNITIVLFKEEWSCSKVNFLRKAKCNV